MESAARRLEFAPPPTPGLLRALFLAILAHGVLLAVLTAGVQWKHDPVQQAVEAELWSAVPVQAAPPAPEPEPQPEPPKPEPVAPPEPKPAPAPTAAEVKAQADIAIAREKAKLLKDKQLALEKEKLAKEKLAKEKLELEKQKLAKQEQDKKDKAKKDQADKLAADKDKLLRKQEQQAQAASAKAREEQMKRMERLAGGTAGGGNTPGGSAAEQSSGPSAGYAGRVAARIKPNITYPDNIDGNPRVEVEIRTAPSGNILSARITQSSGVKSWDDAITRAIEKTEVLPKDLDGSVPRALLIGFRPKD